MIRRRLPVLAYMLVVGVGAFGLWLTEHRFDQSLEVIEADRVAAAKASCESGSETREILRRISYDVGVASGVAGGEALIATVTDAEPEVVDAYRRNLLNQLDPALTDIVNELPDRRWDPEAGECVDVAVEG